MLTRVRLTTNPRRLDFPGAAERFEDPAWAVEEPNLEEIVLGYMSQDDPARGTGPEAARLSPVGGD